MTRRMNDVWLYVDANRPIGDALAVAIEACRRSGARLTLLGAIGRGEDPVFQTSYGHAILRVVRADREARLRDLAILARDALPGGVVRTEMIEADVPWHGVIERAAARAPDLVVVPAPAGSGRSEVDPRRACPVPVWFVPPSTGEAGEWAEVA